MYRYPRYWIKKIYAQDIEHRCQSHKISPHLLQPQNLFTLRSPFHLSLFINRLVCIVFEGARLARVQNKLRIIFRTIHYFRCSASCFDPLSIRAIWMSTCFAPFTYDSHVYSGEKWFVCFFFSELFPIRNILTCERNVYCILYCHLRITRTTNTRARAVRKHVRSTQKKISHWTSNRLRTE